MESPPNILPTRAEQAQRTIHNRLNVHQRRRLQNLPTVSVLAGLPSTASYAWVRWNDQGNRKSVTWSHYCPGSRLETWLATLVSTTDIRRHCLAYLSAQTHTPADEIESRLRHGTAYQRELYYQQLPIAEDGNELANLLRWLLDHIAGGRVLAASDAPVLAKHLGADEPLGEYRVFAAATTILPMNTVPGLLIAIPQEPTHHTRNTAEPSLLDVAAKIAELAPRLPVAVSIATTVLEGYLGAHSESRSKAIIRQGVIRLDKPSAREISAWLVSQGSGDKLDPRSLAETLASYGATPVLLRDAVSLTRTLQSSATSAAGEVARSQAELFLFSLLESIPELTGLFRLNAKLNLRFGNRPMEVDLLAESLGVAVEIDGFYHFQDPENYRRDRRKDLALQRHGFLVMRFLAEDIVSHLEEILDTLRSALQHRRTTTDNQET